MLQRGSSGHGQTSPARESPELPATQHPRTIKPMVTGRACHAYWLPLLAGIAFLSAGGCGMIRRPALSQPGEVIDASDYDWTVWVTASRGRGGGSSFAMSEPLLLTPHGVAFDPWFVGNTVNILGQPGGGFPVEATTCRPLKAGPCSATVGVSLVRPGRVLVQSATAGLQEAVNVAQLHGGGVVEITPRWQGSTSEIASITLPSSVFILDSRGSTGGELYGASRDGTPTLLPSHFAAAGGTEPPGARSISLSAFPGADLGQRITAAAAALGESGEIVVSSPGEIRSPVSLCPHCTLQINAPVTLAAPIALSDGDTVRGNLESAPLTAAIPSEPAVPTALITGRAVTDVSVEDLMVTAPDGKENDVLLTCLACKGVTVTGNLVLNAGIVSLGSTAPGADQTPNPQYPNVNSSTENSEILISNNIGYGPATQINNAIQLGYSNNAVISGNTLQRYASGVEWWGGDACAGNCAGVWSGNGAAGNPRKVSNLSISNNAVYDVTKGSIWGSMGSDVTVSNNVAYGSRDVCIDTEGGDNVTFSDNDVQGAANFQIAAYWLEKNVAIVRNTIYSSHAGWQPMVEVRNPMQTAYDDGPLKIVGNTFVCGDPAFPCAMGTTGGAVDSTEISDNTLDDTTIDATSNNLNEVVIHANQLLFDRPANAPFDAIQVSGASEMPTSTGFRPAYVEISDNKVAFARSEPPGTIAISVSQGDYNSTSLTEIANNVIKGRLGVAIQTVRDSGNPGIVPVFEISGNILQWGTFQGINENGDSQVQFFNNRFKSGQTWPPT